MVYHYWTETNTNYTVSEDLLLHPTMQDFHPAVRSNRDTVVRSIWFPQVHVRVDRAAGAPTPYWWCGAKANLVVVWDSDSSFPEVPTNEGIGDPRVMGVCQMTQATTIYDSTFASVTTFQGPREGLNLEGKRAGLGADLVPQVIGEVWAFDNYGVFDQSHGTHVVVRLSMISRVLWSSTVAP